MSEGCPTCGVSYTKADFGTDGEGHLVEFHVCDTKAIARRHERYERYAQTLVLDLWCLDCQRPYQGTATSMRCRPCAKTRRRKADIAARENLAKARLRKCADCGRPRTKDSEWCRYHQRQNRIRKAVIAAQGRLVRPEEAA